MIVSLFIAWLVAAIVVITVALWVKNRLGRLISEEVEPTLREVRKTLGTVDDILDDARHTVGRVDKVATTIELITGGAALATAATKVVTGSKGTLAGLLFGLKEGLRTFRTSANTKEVVEDVRE